MIECPVCHQPKDPTKSPEDVRHILDCGRYSASLVELVSLIRNGLQRPADR